MGDKVYDMNPDQDMNHANATPRARYARHLPLAVIACVAIAGAILLGDMVSFDTLRTHREALMAFRDGHLGVLTLAFVVVYFGIVAFSLPGGAVASVTGGFLFGLMLGTLLNLAGASLGAIAIFAAARMGLGRMLATRIEASDGTLKRIKDGLLEHEVSVLLLMRLIPIVPFFVANLLPALVGVRFFNYAWTTVLGIVPGTLVYAWVGVGLGEVFDRGEDPDLSLLWEPQIIAPILGLCVLAALPILVRKLRAKKVA